MINPQHPNIKPVIINNESLNLPMMKLDIKTVIHQCKHQPAKPTYSYQWYDDQTLTMLKSNMTNQTIEGYQITLRHHPANPNPNRHPPTHCGDPPPLQLPNDPWSLTFLTFWPPEAMDFEGLEASRTRNLLSFSRAGHGAPSPLPREPSFSTRRVAILAMIMA